MSLRVGRSDILTRKLPRWIARSYLSCWKKQNRWKIVDERNVADLKVYVNESIDIYTQQCVHAYIKENIKAQYYLSFVTGIHRWPVDFFHKWPITWKMFLCHNIVVECTPFHAWAIVQYKDCILGYRIHIINIRRSWDRLIFITEIPMLLRRPSVQSTPCTCTLLPPAPIKPFREMLRC